MELLIGGRIVGPVVEVVKTGGRMLVIADTMGPPDKDVWLVPGELLLVAGGRMMLETPEMIGGRIPPLEEEGEDAGEDGRGGVGDDPGGRRLVTPEMIGGRIPPLEEEGEDAGEDGRGGVRDDAG